MGRDSQAVILWVAANKEGGEAALTARKKGPPKGHGKKLSRKQERQAKEWVVGKCPDQMRLPLFLWTREAVRELLEERFDNRLALSTVGAYLKSWGFAPQEPVRRAFEQNPAAVQRQLTETYPTIAARAEKEGGFDLLGR